MDHRANIQYEIDQTLNSVDGMTVHELAHSLETRIMHQLNRETPPAIGEWKSTKRVVLLNGLAAIFVLGLVLFYKGQSESNSNDPYVQQFSSNSLSYETN